ncbi:MAG TPA: uridine kinase [Acidimicrobiales bacterium]|nr:uridine kinase [Acidimicrobiales bacterium]
MEPGDELGPARAFLIGVAGGTGSGKTTVAERLADLAGTGEVALLKLDMYYRDLNHLPLDERAAVNYDHPEAFDWPLLMRHVDALAAGTPVDVPVYDFQEFVRSDERQEVLPSRIVVVEGILVLAEPDLRARFDLSVYVDTDADVRFIRRLQRDITQRARTPESVISQYLTTVRPMHLQFVEPSKRYADVIIPHGGLNEPALAVLRARVRELVS